MNPKQILINNKQDSIVCDRYVGDYIINAMEEYAKEVSIKFAKYLYENRLSSLSIEELYVEFLTKYT
jgi:hypothetical protein